MLVVTLIDKFFVLQYIWTKVHAKRKKNFGTIKNHKKIILWPHRQDDTWLFTLSCLATEFYKGFTEIYTTILMCVISKYLQGNLKIRVPQTARPPIGYSEVTWSHKQRNFFAPNVSKKKISYLWSQAGIYKMALLPCAVLMISPISYSSIKSLYFNSLRQLGIGCHFFWL